MEILMEKRKLKLPAEFLLPASAAHALARPLAERGSHEDRMKNRNHPGGQINIFCEISPIEIARRDQIASR